MVSSASSTSVSDLHTILEHVRDHLVNISHCDTANIFGYYNGAAAEVYGGSAIDNVKSTSLLIVHLHEQISKGQNAESVIMQRCNDVPNADYIISFALDATGDLASAQSSVSS